MKNYIFTKVIIGCIIAWLPSAIRAQTGELIISTAVGDGNYKEQQKVRVIPPNGKVTPTTTQGRLYIDKEMMMLNSVSSNPSTPENSPQHDKNLPVGTIGGEATIDLNGGGNYSIKLDIPPGTNGMAPDIGINYNSNLGDNQLGLGWSISGFSVIKRENSTIFADNSIKAFDPNCTTFWSATPGNPICPIYLDGVKLVPEQSTNNTFYLENDNFSKITYDASNSYFLVETKGGLKMEYGRNTNTNNSLRKIVNNTKDYAWYLNKVYDNYGNYTEYSYYNVDGEIAIKEIKYTGNANINQSPYNSVKFYYNFRVDGQQKFFYNDDVTQTLQLREIETFSEGSSVFRYEFKYAYEDFNYLTSITKIAADGSRFNPTYFAYGLSEGPKLVQKQAALKQGSTAFSPTQDYVTADFNNDGKTDMLEFSIMANSTNPSNGYKVYDGWKLFLNTNNGEEFELAQSEILTSGNYAAAFVGSYGYAFGIHPTTNGIEIGDINGDGYMDLVYSIADATALQVKVAAFVFNPATNQLEPLTLTYTSSGSCASDFFGFRQGGNGHSFDALSLLNSSNPNNNTGSTSMTMGDFNGDGKSELLTFFKKPNINSQVDLFFFSNFMNPAKTSINGVGSLHAIHKDGSANLVSQIGSQTLLSLNDYSGFSAADYNGDGRTDLIAYKYADSPTNIRLVILEVQLGLYSINAAHNCNLSFKEIAQYPISSATFPADHASSGDFNGDGYLDFISHPYLSPLESSISFGTGSSFTQNADCSNIGRRGLKKKFIGLDVNADGISDLVKLETYANLDVTAEVILGQNITKNVTFENYGTIGVFVTNDGINFCGMPDNKDYLHPNCDYDYDLNQTTPANCLNPNLDPDDIFDSDPNKIPYYGIGDFDGDGYNDIIYRKGCTNGPYFQIIYFKPKYGNKFLTRVIDGLNKKTDFSYSTIAQENYTKSATNYVYPNVRVNYPFNIAKSLSSTSGANLNGNTTEETINYSYEDLIINKLGKGLIGFQKVKSENTLTNYTTEQTFTIMPDYFVKLPYQTKTSSSSQDLSIQTSSYSIINKNVVGVLDQSLRKRYQLQLANSTEVNVVRGITSTSDFVYDSDGNVTQNTNTIVGKKTTVIDYSNYVNAGSWLNNKPKTIITTNSYTGQSPAHVRQMDYLYDMTKGHCLTETSNISQQKSVVTTKQYNANTGVLIKSIITAPNEPSPPTPIPTTNTYDSKFRFVISESSSGLNYVNAIEYNYKLGIPLKTTTSDGLITRMYYDAFGRLQKILDPQNNVVNKTTNWYTASAARAGDVNPVNADLTVYYTESKQAGKPTTRTYYDIDDRIVKTDVEGFSDHISNRIDYDIYGNVKKEIGPFSVPLPAATPIVEKTNVYSTGLNELTSVTVSDGTINNNTTFTYNYNTTSGEMIVTSTSPDGKVTTRKTDKADRVIETSDNGGTLTFSYYNNEKIHETILGGTVIKKMVYDAFDFPYQEIEKNSGTKQFDYNSFGWIKGYSDANGTTFTYAYDDLGRVLTEAMGGDSYNYTYNNSGYGKGQIATMVASYGPEFNFQYDNFGRMVRKDEIINSVTYSNKYAYDNLNNIIKHTYPNNFAIRRNYNTRGYATNILADVDNEVIWQADKMDHFGNYTKYTKGNTLQTTETYNSLGIPQSFVAGNIQDLVFKVNNQNGNLEKITDNVSGNFEEYEYDNLDRLTLTKLNSLNPLSIGYDAKGNLTSKFGIGSLTYGPLKHNQVIAAANTNAEINSQQQQITYTFFDKTKHVTEGVNELDIVYGPSQDRMKTTFWQNGGVLKQRLYIGQTEIEQDGSNAETQTVNYIMAPNGLCAMQVVQGSNKNIYYPYFDHLGSILTVTDKLANVVAEQNFDAWGRRRDAGSWLYSSLNSIPSWLSRGYTGHEMLEQFDLINMNGRMYDSKLGRMLSVDPVLQDGTSTQAYNKYSYCLNNPLKYTDPSGYRTHSTAGANVLNKAWGSLVPWSQPAAGAKGKDGNGYAVWGNNFDGNLNNNTGNTDTKNSGPGGLSAAYESFDAKNKEAAQLLMGRKLYYISSVDANGVKHNFYTTLFNVVYAYTKPKDVADDGITATVHGDVENLGNGQDFDAKAGDPPGLNGWQHAAGPTFYWLASPVPKRFIGKNTSQASSVLSEAMSKMIKKKIEVAGKKRLYTHTVNGSARYASTWGRFLGRWGTRFAGPIGIALTTFDLTSFMYEHKEEIKEGLEARDNYIQQGLMPLR